MVLGNHFEQMGGAFTINWAPATTACELSQGLTAKLIETSLNWRTRVPLAVMNQDMSGCGSVKMDTFTDRRPNDSGHVRLRKGGMDTFTKDTFTDKLQRQSPAIPPIEGLLQHS